MKSVNLTDTGVEAVLSLTSNIKIPADLEAEVHSVSAVGEQYVSFSRAVVRAVLKDGDVIPQDRTRVPTDVNTVLATNNGLAAIPRDNLKTAVDEAYIAFGGLGPELSRLVDGGTALAIDARKNLDPLTTLIDQSKPILDTDRHRGFDPGVGVESGDCHRSAANTGRRGGRDPGEGAGAADELQALFDRLQPTLPIVLANLVSLGEVAVTYQPSLEQLLVLLPQGTATTAGNRRGQAEHHPGLQGRLPDPQPEPQPAAAMHHRFPADPAAGRRASRTIRIGRPVTCTAASRRTRRSTCAVPATCPASRFLANGRHGEAVREQRELHTAQRRLELEG